MEFCYFARCVSSAWLECLPVTQEVTGSSPVRTARLQRQMNAYEWQSPQNQWFVGFVFLVSAIPKTNKCPVQTKLRCQIVTEKPGFRNCNDFPRKSLICRPLSLKCPLVNQLLIGAGAQDTTGTGSCPHRNTWTRARTRRWSGGDESGECAEAGHSHSWLHPWPYYNRQARYGTSRSPWREVVNGSRHRCEREGHAPSLSCMAIFCGLCNKIHRNKQKNVVFPLYFGDFV